MKLRLLAILFFLAATLSVRSNDAQDSAAPNAAIAKLAPLVLQQTASGAETEFFVILSDQADLSGAATLGTKKEKGEYVYERLWRKAQETQRSIVDWLRERGIQHRSFYIVNALLIRADRGAALELAARSGVARIEANPRIQNVHPAPAIISESALRAEAVESNIAYTGAPGVWAQGLYGQGAVVGGGDTGYLWTHTALRSHYRGSIGKQASHDFNWHDSVHSRGGSCGPDSLVPCDDSGHGTHTMGFVAGDDGAGNQIGMAPGAKWIGCRNMDQGNGAPATYMECFQFFLAPYPVNGTPAQGDPSMAPDVTTNSWTCPKSEGCSPLTLHAAIEAQRAAGIVTAVAAGNYLRASCSSIADPPSLYDASLTVGAVDHRTGEIADFSGQGPIAIDGSNRMKPDITAPGVSVRSSYSTSKTSYAVFSGTSMATPHVAGAIALLISAQPRLRGNVPAIEGILKDSAVHIPLGTCGSSGWPNNAYGYGRLDAKAAVDIARTTFAPPSAVFGTTGGEGSLTVSAPPGVFWFASSNASWITITSGSGIGDGTVTFLVHGNPGEQPRAGAITIARRDFAVRQQGSGGVSCSYALELGTRKFPSRGGDGSLRIATTGVCLWTATSDADWVTVTGDGGGLGTGAITFTVSANNTGASRKGTINVSRTTISIKQKG